MRSSPALIDSSPATTRSVVLLPHPDGPTSTTSSPSFTSRSTPCTAVTSLPPCWYTFFTPLSVTLAIHTACRDESRLSFSRTIPLGRRHVGLSDRRLDARRWCGAEHLGSVLSHAREDRERGHGGHRHRSLSPLRSGRRLDGATRPAVVPLQHRLGKNSSRGNRARQRRWTRVLRQADRRTPREEDRADGDALPLGSSRGARRARRLAQSRHRELVRRICEYRLSRVR